VVHPAHAADHDADDQITSIVRQVQNTAAGLPRDGDGEQDQQQFAMDYPSG